MTSVKRCTGKLLERCSQPSEALIMRCKLNECVQDETTMKGEVQDDPLENRKRSIVE